jgi:hypothetical protein
MRFKRVAEVPGSKETRVGVSKENLDEDLRPDRRASACMRLWDLRMPTLSGISQIVNRSCTSHPGVLGSIPKRENRRTLC